MAASLLGVIIATATVGGLVDAWVESKIVRQVGPIVADVRQLGERIDALVRAQEWATYKELLAARAALRRKADSRDGLSEAERIEFDRLETEIDLLRQRLRGNPR